MAEETIAKRGRPKGARTAEVELDTMSFKIPPKLKASLLAYAKRHRRSVSEVIREAIERGISKSGEGMYERDNAELRGMVETLLSDGREREKQFMETTDIAIRLLRQRAVVTGALSSGDIGDTQIALPVGDTPARIGAARSTSEQSSAGIVPEFDPAKYALGSLCEKGHDADGQGHSLRQLGGKHECRECKNMRSRAYKERLRQAQPVIG